MASSIPAEPPEAQQPESRLEEAADVPSSLDQVVDELGRLLAENGERRGTPAEASGETVAQATELLRQEISTRLDGIERALAKRLARADRRLSALEQRQGALAESQARLRKVIKAIGTYVRRLGQVVGDGGTPVRGSKRRDRVADHVWREPR